MKRQQTPTVEVDRASHLRRRTLLQAQETASVGCCGELRLGMRICRRSVWWLRLKREAESEAWKGMGQSIQVRPQGFALTVRREFDRPHLGPF